MLMQFPGMSAQGAHNEPLQPSLVHHAQPHRVMSAETEPAQRAPMVNVATAPEPNPDALPTWSDAMANVIGVPHAAPRQQNPASAVNQSAVAAVTVAAQAAAAAAAAAVPGATIAAPSIKPAPEEDAQRAALLARRVAKVNETADMMRDKWEHPPGPQEETIVFHRIKALLEVAELSQSFVCRCAAITQGAMSQYMRCLFRGRQDVLEEKIEKFIDDFLKGNYDGHARRGTTGRRSRPSVGAADARPRSRAQPQVSTSTPPQHQHHLLADSNMQARIQQQHMHYRMLAAQQQQQQALTQQRYQQHYGASSVEGTAQRYPHTTLQQRQYLQQHQQQRYNQYSHAQQQQRAQVLPHPQSHQPIQPPQPPPPLAPLLPTVAVERAFHAYHTSKWDNPFSDAEPVLLPIKISVSLDELDEPDTDTPDVIMVSAMANGCGKDNDSRKTPREQCVSLSIDEPDKPNADTPDVVMVPNTTNGGKNDNESRTNPHEECTEFVPSKDAGSATAPTDVTITEQPDSKLTPNGNVSVTNLNDAVIDKQTDQTIGVGNAPVEDKAAEAANSNTVIEVNDKPIQDDKSIITAKEKATTTSVDGTNDVIMAVDTSAAKTAEPSDDVTNHDASEPSLLDNAGIDQRTKLDVLSSNQPDATKPATEKKVEKQTVDEPQDQFMVDVEKKTELNDKSTTVIKPDAESKLVSESKPDGVNQTFAKDGTVQDVKVRETPVKEKNKTDGADATAEVVSKDSSVGDDLSLQMKIGTPKATDPDFPRPAENPKVPEQNAQKDNLDRQGLVNTAMNQRTSNETTAENEKIYTEGKPEGDTKTDADEEGKKEIETSKTAPKSNNVIQDNRTEARIDREAANGNGADNVNGKEIVLRESVLASSSQPTLKDNSIRSDVLKTSASKASDTAKTAAAKSSDAPTSKTKKTPQRSLDFFTQWDVNERLLSPEEVAEGIVAKRGCDPMLTPKIAAQIRHRLFEAGVVCPVPPAERSKENRRRIRIHVPLGDGEEVLSDSFDWDICLGEYNSPELFAQHLCSDNGFSQYHVPKVAQEIRRQVAFAQAIAYGDAHTRKAALTRLSPTDPLRDPLPPLDSGIRRLTSEEIRANERNAKEKMIRSGIVESLFDAVVQESSKREIVREIVRGREHDRVVEQQDSERRRKEHTRSRMEVDAAKHRVRDEHGIDLTSYLNLKLARGVNPCVWLEGLLIRKRRGIPVMPSGLANSVNSGSKDAEPEQNADAKVEPKPKPTRGRPRKKREPSASTSRPSSNGPGRPRRGAPRKSRSSAASAAASSTPSNGSATPASAAPSASGASGKQAATPSGSERKRRSSTRTASASQSSKRARR